MFGVVGLAYNLVLTRRATRVAVEATEGAGEALKVATRNADAAAAQVALAEETAKRQLRAYVFAERAHVVFLESDKSPLVKINFKNSGQTPAYRLRSWVVVEFKKLDDVDFHVVADENRARRFDLGPGADTNMLQTTKEQTFNVDMALDLRAGRTVLFVYGVIKYLDCFGSERTGRFSFLYNGTGMPGNDRLMGYHHQGNEYD